VEKKTGLHLNSGSCSDKASCLSVVEEKQGVNAATVQFEADGSAVGPVCLAYVYEDSGGWHYFDSICGQLAALGPMVGARAAVFVDVEGQCARVRRSAGMSGSVAGCLENGTEVLVDGGPNYADGVFWWHIQDTGWMAHEALKPA
jgi:hypothetical protein